MKNLILLPVVAIFLASCSQNDTSSDPIADLAVQNNMVVESQWTVNQFIDSGKDETSDFSGYTFKFNTDGTLISVSSGTTFEGTWVLIQGKTSPDDSGNLSDDDKLNKLTINITGNKNMDHLSQKWLVDKITASEIWLRDDNPTSIEILKFGK
jgi:heat shock protein HslJ